MAFSLSPKQAKVKDYLIHHMANNDGQCPTYAEIAAGCGMASTNSPRLLVKSLIERGHVRVLPGRKRAIQIIADDVPPPHDGV